MEMVCILKTVLIFCLVPLIKAVSLRIDGSIELNPGPNWNYEYRILRSSKENMTKHSIGRQGKNLLSSGLAYPRNGDEQRVHKDEKILHKAEQRFRKEAEQLHIARDQIYKQTQVEAHSKHQESAQTGKHHQALNTLHEQRHLRIPEESHKKAETPEPIEHGKHSEHRFPDFVFLSKPRRTTENKLETKRDSEPALIRLNEPEPKRKRKSDHKKKKKKHTLHKPSTSTSRDSENDSTSSDNLELKAPIKIFTMFDMYDFTTTRKPRIIRTTESETEFVNEVVASFVKDFNKHENSSIQRKILRLGNIKMEEVTNTTTQNVIMAVPNARKLTTTQVTTVRTAEIFSDPHKVKDDAKIKEFNDYIHKQSLKVFDVIKQKTSLYRFKKRIEVLAKSYEDKFKEFLRETRNQKIRTRLGTQKVILNTIDMSNHLLKRLTNFMIVDMNNVATANIFRKEIEKEYNSELNHACKNIGICRTQNGFSVFLTDTLAILLGTNNIILKQSLDAIAEVVKNADFNNVLDKHVERKLKASMYKMQTLPLDLLRPSIMIIKNVIQNKNRPIIFKSVSAVASSRVNCTLAFLEIIDLLDQKIPPNEANTLEWDDIKTSLKDFSEGERNDVQEIMEAFLKRVNKIMGGLDEMSKIILSKNLDDSLECSRIVDYKIYY